MKRTYMDDETMFYTTNEDIFLKYGVQSSQTQTYELAVDMVNKMQGLDKSTVDMLVEIAQRYQVNPLKSICEVQSFDKFVDEQDLSEMYKYFDNNGTCQLVYFINDAYTAYTTDIMKLIKLYGYESVNKVARESYLCYRATVVEERFKPIDENEEQEEE